MVKAERNGWGVPGTDEDLDILKKQDFFDAMAASNYPPTKPWHTASTSNPMYRIDYCFIRSKFMEVDQSKILEQAKDFSDHFPVLFDIEQSIPEDQMSCRGVSSVSNL